MLLQTMTMLQSLLNVAIYTIVGIVLFGLLGLVVEPEARRDHLLRCHERLPSMLR